MRMKILLGLAIVALVGCEEAKDIVYSDPTVAITGQTVPLTQGDLVDAVAIMPGDTLAQKFRACGPFDGLRVSIVTWTQQPTPYPVGWKLKDGDGNELGSGYFEAAKLSDWQKVAMPVKGVAGDFVLELSSPSGSLVKKPAGIAVAAPMTSSTPVTLRNGRPVPKVGAVQMWIVGSGATACPA